MSFSALRLLCAATLCLLPSLAHAQAPYITQQPRSQSAAAGTTVSFTVAATGKAPLSYYWSFNGTTLTDGGRVSGARTATLTISGVVTADAGAYQVVVSNRQGAATSSPATLSVFVPVTITQSPQSQTVLLGSNVTLTAAAAGTAPLRYQWRFNGVPLSNATGTSLALANVQATNAGSYTMVVTNLYGSATSAPAVLRVILPPTLSDLPNQRTFPAHPTRAVPFAVGDAQTSASTLTLVGCSSDPTLVPNQNIVFGGAGSNRTVTVTPVGSATGMVSITVTVQNSYGSATSKSFQVTVAGFSEVNADFAPLTLSAAAWGDYNNDGRLDLLLSGLDTNGTRVTKLYRNNANAVFTDTGAALEPLYAGMVAWGDYDNDGYLDILANGVVSGNQGLGQIYHNETNGLFTNVLSIGGYTCEPNATYRQGMVAWGDSDSDGHLEPLFAGVGGVMMHYNPVTKGFDYADSPAPLSWQAATIWADFNNDVQLDLFASGWDGASVLYPGGGASPWAVTGAEAGPAAAGDFDNDGYLDLAVEGYFGTYILRNLGGTNFSPVASGLPGRWGCMTSVAWGDYDNDGLPDLLIAAPDRTGLYRNLGNGTFADSGLVLPGTCFGMALWADYDNDRKLDILVIGQSDSGYIARLYHNDGAMPNTPPSPPDCLNSSVTSNSVLLSWTAATDAQQAGGLSYNVRLGTAPGASDVVDPMADQATGFRRLPALGKASLQLSYAINNLSPGTYYWSVQAIDNTFAGSAFAPEASFHVNAPPTISSVGNLIVPPGVALPWISFVINDAETPASALVLAASSSNGTLVPNDQMWFGGSGTNRTLCVTPAAGQLGTTTITITVQDAAGATASTSFTLTIGAFKDSGVSLLGLSYGAAAWGDYDNDNDLDLLVTGLTTNIAPRTRLYRNDGQGVFTEVPTVVTNVGYSSLAWADYDNDGWLDLAITGGDGSGNDHVWLYHNQGGSFTLATVLPGDSFGTVAWGDYDNDGRLDLLVTGYGATALYRNNGSNGFTKVTLPSLTAVTLGDAAWGDYNCDGALDFVVAGTTSGTNRLTYLYRNNGNGTFAKFSGLPGVDNASEAWGNYDEDGYLDLLLIGYSAASSWLAGIYRYDPATGSFVEAHAAVPLVTGGAGVWGDFDNDGVADIALSGTSQEVGRSPGVYLNFNGVYTNCLLALPRAGHSFLAAADYDNDGSLDVVVGGTDNLSRPVTVLYRNQVAQPKAPAGAPSALGATPYQNGVSLAWSPPPTNYYAYGTRTFNLRVGTTPGASDVLSPMAAGNGFRRVAQRGNAGHSLDWQMKSLRAGTYYWSVQAIDQAFAGSAFAPEQTFTLAAPVITNQPLSQTVFTNGNALLSVGAMGTEPLVYQWYQNGNAMAGQTTATLGISNVRTNDAGSYYAIVTNWLGAATSSVAVLTVPVPPTIWQQPQDQVGATGSNITFAATVTGTAPLAFQWFCNGGPLANGGRISGADTSALTIANLQMSDGGSYHLVVTNLMGMATSSVARLEVFAPPIIAKQPVSQAIALGNQASFAVQATGTDLSYQWFCNGSKLTDGSRIGGSATPALTIANVQPSDAGDYTVLVSNRVGSLSSAPATLTVLIPPMIIVGPASQTVIQSNNIWFTVTALGTTPLFYYWFKDGVSVADGGRISGAGTEMLLFTGALTNDAGQYSVVVSNAYGVATSTPAQLTVLVPPSLVTQPASQTVVLGSNTVFSAEAAGTEPLGYQWFFNGVPLTDSARISGSASASLTISNVQVSDAGSYTLKVSNAATSITSAAAELTVLQPPVITAQPIGRSLVVGLPTSFSASASGTPPLSYQWQLNGVDIPGATNTSYAIEAAALGDFGTYTMAVSNLAAVTVSAPAVLNLGTVAAWGRNDAGQTVVPPDLANVLMTAAGLSHSLALQAEGRVVAWGGNTYGQTNVPGNLTNVAAIAAGYYHNLALRADGTVAAWGYNNYGQSNVPAGLTNVVAIAAGGYHSLAVRADGVVVAWGRNDYGQATVPAGLRKVVAVAAGTYHSLALRSDGTAIGWGYNSYGQTSIPANWTNVAALAGGYYHSLTLLADGTVAVWSSYYPYSPTNIPPNLTNTVAIAAGDYHCLALRADGRLAAWGRNDYGQTNTPASLTNLVSASTRGFHNLALVATGGPLLVRQPAGGTFCVGRALQLQAQAVGAAPLSFQWQHNGTDIGGATNAVLSLPSLTLADAGTYQLLVSNAFGSAASVPVPVTVLEGVRPAFTALLPALQTNYLSSRLVLSIPVSGCGPLSYQWRYQGQNIPGATNEELTFDPLRLTNAGPYSLSVSNAFGSIASPQDYLQVIQVKAFGSYRTLEAPLTVTNAVSVSAGPSGYLAVLANGTVMGWGIKGPPGGYLVPKGLSNVVAAAAGYDHSVALRADGTVTAWGANNYGQTNVPAGLNNVVAVAAGDSHALALRADGTVVAWGYNYSGQTAVPASASNVVAIAAGRFHSLALRADGAVVGWGQNAYGQAPPLKPGSNFVAIATGDYQSVGLRADGTVFAWGGAYYGGYYNSGTNVPAGLSNVVAVASGGGHCLALRSDGTVVSWGSYYDQVPLVPPPDLAHVIRIASSANQDVVLFGTRAPSITVPPLNRTLFRGSTASFIGKAVGASPMQLQWLRNGAAIPGATSDALSLTNVQLSDSGAYQLVASNAYGSASTSAKLVATIPFAEALDTTNLAWTSMGSAPWFGEEGITFDGLAAARSGGIGNGQETILQASLIGPGRLTYWWKVSSEEDFDLLEFRLNGVTQAAISGEVDWEQRSFAIPAGTQLLQWRYSKDASFTDGQDAGWLDQVQFIPDLPVLTGQPASLMVNAGATVSWSVAATGTPPFTYQWFKDGNGLAGATASNLTLTNATRRTGGLYAVQVANGGGATLSSNAVLKVLVPQLLGPPRLLPGGSIVLTSGDADGGLLTAADLANFEAQTSTNLVNWTSLPGALTLTNGLLQLQHSGSLNQPCRFYRLIER